MTYPHGGYGSGDDEMVIPTVPDGPAPGAVLVTSGVPAQGPGPDLDSIEARAATAWRSLHSALIASYDRLNVPFSDRPELSPWTLSIKPAQGLRRSRIAPLW